MKSTVETLSPTRVRLAVEVPYDELKPAVDAAYKAIGSQLRIPGFRPGKVPTRVIDQRLGQGAVLEQAVTDALPRVYTDAAREHNVQPMGQPEIDITQAADPASGSALQFTAEVDVRPEIDLPDVSGLQVSVEDTTVSDEEVEEQLDGLRTRFGTLTGVERAVEDGDFVSLDLTTTVDGEEIEEGQARGLSYQVGTGNLVVGLDDAILGKSAGDTTVFTTTLAQGDHADSEADVTVVVNSVKERELPELDDEFAQLASEFDTVDELRDDLRERLGRAKTMAQGAQARDAVLAALLDSVEFPVPEGAVKAEVDYREHELLHSLNHDDELVERYLSMQGKTREEYTAELQENAEKSVRAQLLLDAIADRDDVQVGDAELTAYLVRQAQRYDIAPKEFANQVIEAGNLPALVADVRRNKALAEVMGAAVITDASGNPVDLNALSTDLTELDEAPAEA